MQTNNQGQIAVKRLRQNQKLVKISKDKYYVFTPRNNICMAWIDEDDLNIILSMKRRCCGGSEKQEFWLASEQDVRRYLHGGR